MKFFENIRTIIGEIIGLIGGYLWASKTNWDDYEPLILLAVSGVGLMISLGSKFLSQNNETYENQKTDENQETNAFHNDFAIKTFTENNEEICELKGNLEVNTMTWQTKVSLPLFKSKSQISLNRPNGQLNKLPQIIQITDDSFTIKIDSSSEAGVWNWRAIGQLRK